MRNQLSIFATLVLWFTTASFLIVGATLFFLFRAFEQYNASRSRSGAGMVVRQGDRIVFAVGDVPPIEAFPPPSSDRTTFPVIAYDSGEQHFLLSSAAVMRGGRRYVIAMALDQTKSQEALEDFRSNA
ncbi:MAG TPA: hypothetical protein VN605_10225 [Thermoanaerobaculia bacterium]|nr:hypothetical protein [Thermoanaerobaculia bacterium]